ncbi:hypothetical protein FC093_10915 [Ilyomonas limi]|uniref:Sulfatase N-terminal domain-containing protein n=1 Tax=Ilyomonas limi TaxID=2575867 RepID=A0A4U3L0J8_9BACT|nr:sulfatase-like hydrolase/transferase [Ilyomonas limi]TKK68621.1 hypothetical protein FC093_10915 [Ilyomonas limi]
MKKLTLIPCALLLLCLSSCNKPGFDNKELPAGVAQDAVKSQTLRSRKPNILLLVADDIGYEVPAYTGGQSYQTPNIDSLARVGRQFSDANSTPLCSPSRQSFLTGKYNNQNYTTWGTMLRDQKTIANMLRSNGYATAVSGKWQLDGGDVAIRGFGFSDYLVFLPYNGGDESEENKGRYKDPTLYQKGAYLPQSATQGKYADDMFVDFTSRFIDSVNRNTSKPFFVYHSFSLCHMPFSPTPDNPDYATWDFAGGASSKKYFPDMVRYMDKEVGKLMDTLKAKNLLNNTIVIFCSDNGTPKSITSTWNNTSIDGAKGLTNVYGTHVPFIVAGPGIKPGIKNNIIDFTDLMPTMADLAGIPQPTTFGHLDGVSFYGAIYDLPFTARDWTYIYYKPLSSAGDKRFKVFARQAQYKKYDETDVNHFYDIINDPLEEHPITNPTPEQKKIKQQLNNVINTQEQYNLQ